MHATKCNANKGTAAAVPALRLRDVQFAWLRSRAPVIRIEGLTVPRGARVFLRGPSGSGKSTLLGLVGGVVRPQTGLIEVLGRELTAMSAAARDRFRAEHIGFVFQQFNLLPYLGVIDNVLLAIRFSEQRCRRIPGDAETEARRCLAALGLTDEAVLQAPVTQLSVGQQQRVAVARALLGSPPLVIADEPTSALDTDTRSAFMRLLAEECARSGATLLFVSHDRSLAAGFDQVIDLPSINAAGTEETP